MNDEYNYMWYEKGLRDILTKSNDPFVKLDELSIFNFQNIDLNPPVFGFIIPLKEIFDIKCEKYFFVIGCVFNRIRLKAFPCKGCHYFK